MSNKLAIVVIAIILLLAVVVLQKRENVVSSNITAGGPDNITYVGVLASGQDRMLDLPRNRIPVVIGNEIHYM